MAACPYPRSRGDWEIGRLAVYAMLEQGILPGIRLGRRWIITRHAYDAMGADLRHAALALDFIAPQELTVLN